MNCPVCGVPLNESVHTQDGHHKSCPSCSLAAGRHQFLPVGHFGLRTVGGRQYIQSHCPECRASPKLAPQTPAFTC